MKYYLSITMRTIEHDPTPLFGKVPVDDLQYPSVAAAHVHHLPSGASDVRGQESWTRWQCAHLTIRHRDRHGLEVVE